MPERKNKKNVNAACRVNCIITQIQTKVIVFSWNEKAKQKHILYQ